jgi:hypothetical protein
MSRKRDPVLAVLQYFEDADLPLAQQALTLVQQIVRRKSPGQTSGRVRPSRAKPRAVAGDTTSQQT